MKKQCFVVVLLLCVLMCAPVWAVDVNLGGEKIGEARAVDGATYLPLRLLFERCGANVDYVYAEKKIVAVRPDGVRIEMTVGGRTASVTDNGEVTEYALERTPYAEDGHIYVPVRFVAENLLCDVDWREGAVWVEPQFYMWDDYEEIYYDSKFYLRECDGRLFEFNRSAGTARMLGQLPLADWGIGQLGRDIKLELTEDSQKTRSENYLLCFSVWDRVEENTDLGQYAAWFCTGDSSKNIYIGKIWDYSVYCRMENSPLIYLGTKAGLQCINEKTGEITMVRAESEAEFATIGWAYQNWVLLGQRRLLDVTSGERVDLYEMLVTDEVKQQVGEEFSWSFLGATNGAENAFLTFRVRAERTDSDNFVDLVYAVPLKKS